MPNFDNDIAPGANYMDRKRCFSIYFFTRLECSDCPHCAKCLKQQKKEKENGENKDTHKEQVELLV